MLGNLEKSEACSRNDGGIGGMLGRSWGYSGGNWGTHAFYHADGNGNITCLITNQTVVASYRYDPYGRSLGSSGSLAGANIYRFSSKPLHANSGLYYYGYRFYWPELQRWIRADPIGERGGRNLYVYVKNVPTDLVDPSGMVAVVPIVIGVGGVVAVGGGLACLWYYRREHCLTYLLGTFTTAEKEAEAAAPDNSRHEDEGSVADALAHCIGACRFARQPGPCWSAERALAIAQDREDTSKGPGRMDAMNNLVGWTLGKNAEAAKKTCVDACLDILNAGGLYSFGPGDRLRHLPAP